MAGYGTNAGGGGGFGGVVSPGFGRGYNKPFQPYTNPGLALMYQGAADFGPMMQDAMGQMMAMNLANQQASLAKRQMRSNERAAAAPAKYAYKGVKNTNKTQYAIAKMEQKNKRRQINAIAQALAGIGGGLGNLTIGGGGPYDSLVRTLGG